MWNNRFPNGLLSRAKKKKKKKKKIYIYIYIYKGSSITDKHKEYIKEQS